MPSPVLPEPLPHSGQMKDLPSRAVDKPSRWTTTASGKEFTSSNMFKKTTNLSFFRQCQEFCVIRIVDLTPFFQRKIFRVPWKKTNRVTELFFDHVFYLSPTHQKLAFLGGLLFTQNRWHSLFFQGDLSGISRQPNPNIFFFWGRIFPLKEEGKARRRVSKATPSVTIFTIYTGFGWVSIFGVLTPFLGTFGRRERNLIDEAP